MHELSLLDDLLGKIEALVQEHQAQRVLALTLRIGCLAHISPEHLRHHFLLAAPGTVVEGARLEIKVLNDLTHPQAQEIVLEAVELDA
ncbi:MAG: hydrogenase maturation nickel metallochaperone HypA [Deltaproteobacteria bacterium]|nr:hydrogenase maturation nickel metallochaperone HypA [Deltaproteobacteria bacterium]MBW1952972.1 hydrogenase maturation nickel metallochaperone HypA [Deltaproteobacteria bacterium]MBW1987757.1 hydrogenase maturation nickel metallochaperone HypA [Deltaproteobacteria bacterium]MBW2135727.1 hydrogenase maturation nickel metallochaperone HypA [Deltaproteobacteria bacterium]